MGHPTLTLLAAGGIPNGSPHFDPARCLRDPALGELTGARNLAAYSSAASVQSRRCRMMESFCCPARSVMPALGELAGVHLPSSVASSSSWPQARRRPAPKHCRFFRILHGNCHFYRFSLSPVEFAASTPLFRVSEEERISYRFRVASNCIVHPS